MLRSNPLPRGEGNQFRLQEKPNLRWPIWTNRRAMHGWICHNTVGMTKKHWMKVCMGQGTPTVFVCILYVCVCSYSTPGLYHCWLRKSMHLVTLGHEELLCHFLFLTVCQKQPECWFNKAWSQILDARHNAGFVSLESKPHESASRCQKSECWEVYLHSTKVKWGLQSPDLVLTHSSHQMNGSGR